MEKVEQIQYSKVLISSIPAISVNHDLPDWTIKEITTVFTFADKPAEFLQQYVQLKEGYAYEWQAKTSGLCNGIFFTAFMNRQDGSRNLLCSSTDYNENFHIDKFITYLSLMKN
jgi:hypothetical protein